MRAEDRAAPCNITSINNGDSRQPHECVRMGREAVHNGKNCDIHGPTMVSRNAASQLGDPAIKVQLPSCHSDLMRQEAFQDGVSSRDLAAKKRSPTRVGQGTSVLWSLSSFRIKETLFILLPTKKANVGWSRSWAYLVLELSLRSSWLELLITYPGWSLYPQFLGGACS